ncbi:anaerobic ribonucleoside-triphosphate reductase activating protein [Candidatus Woesearchaeota archaeon]|nr:anaerobic ribonucleoside-triphosphate reductase activating protein [Candidatus Woesearchaeota archaeon]
MDIKGITKTDLLNYAPYTAATVFVGGCNFLCPFCQNPELVLGYDKLKSIPEDEIFNFLSKRKKWLEGVCITGGEPTLNSDLPEFTTKLKKMDYLVKLDTNGSNPRQIKGLIDNKLVDYIAMDIKAPIGKYDRITQVETNKEDIQRSIDIIRNSSIMYEFRITVVPKLIGAEDITEIGMWLKGANRFVLQQFRNKQTLNPSFTKLKPFSKEELSGFRNILEPYFTEVELNLN